MNVQRVPMYCFLWCTFIFMKTNALHKALKNTRATKSALHQRLQQKGSSHFGFRWSISSCSCIDSFKPPEPVPLIIIFFLHMQDHNLGWKGPQEFSSSFNLLLKAAS